MRCKFEYFVPSDISTVTAAAKRPKTIVSSSSASEVEKAKEAIQSPLEIPGEHDPDIPRKLYCHVSISLLILHIIRCNSYGQVIESLIKEWLASLDTWNSKRELYRGNQLRRRRKRRREEGPSEFVFHRFDIVSLVGRL